MSAQRECERGVRVLGGLLCAKAHDGVSSSVCERASTMRAGKCASVRLDGIPMVPLFIRMLAGNARRTIPLSLRLC